MKKAKERKLSEKAVEALDFIIDIICFSVGSAIFALGLNMFALPNTIICGGVTGIATTVNHFFPNLPVGTVMLVLNIPLFAAAFAFLGKKLFFRSFIATVILSVMIDLFAVFVPAGTQDKLLASVFYGVCSGVGLAVIYVRNATSGGTDILAKLIKKRFPHLSMGRLVFAVDLVVIAVSSFALKDIESALYAAVVVFISGEFIDQILYGTANAKTFTIVTTKPEEMSREIISKLNRGATMLNAKGAYTEEEKGVLICVVRTTEVRKLTRLVRSVDENAFTIVTEAGEILGEGFKSLNEEEK